MAEETLFRRIDCLRLPVADLEDALRFYRDRLNLPLRWRTDSAAGLALGDAELVVHTEADPPEVDLLVDSVADALPAFTAAGGEVVQGPFEIAIGQCAVVADPWGNRLVLLDMTKGMLRTDERGNVVADRASPP